MRTTKTLTISLPPAMAQMAKTMQRREQRTFSELVREALRERFYSQFPVYTPTKAELRGIAKGRAAFMRGDYVSLEELRHEFESKNHRPGKKATGRHPSKR